jgi:transcriptional regulator with XRE-family HTH domain
VRTKTLKYSRGPGSIDAALGLKIRRRRQALGLSQKSLGDKLGVTPQQIHDYEHGLTKMSVGRLVEIARALDCPFPDFVGEFDKAARQLAVPIDVGLGLAEAPQLLGAYSAMPRPLRRTTLKLLVAIAADQAAARQDDSAVAAPGKLRKDRHVPRQTR